MPGGVCARLDYDVELMAEYVAEMATRLALGDAVVTVPFRKFICQILSSTRLPHTTILLGMNYLAKRINIMNLSGPRTPMPDGHMWRYLTVALMLGSKFLDDNTFQNRSWSEVSGIAVRELNTLEHEWMDAINWHLYVDLDRSADYNAWLKSWQDWSENRERQRVLAARERSAPIISAIDADLARSRNASSYATWHQQQVAEYERLSSLKRTEQNQPNGYRPREPSWSYSQPTSTWPNPPVTPPDSGYGTPEYLNSATASNAHYNEWFGQHSQPSNQSVVGHNYARQPSHQYRQASVNHGPYHARSSSNYPSYFYGGHSIWEQHPADCTCLDCATVRHKQQPYYGMSHGFGQPVMG